MQPTLEGVDLSLAIARYHLEDLDGARVALARAESKNPERAGVQLYRGLLLIDDAASRLGVDALERARQLDPGYADQSVAIEDMNNDGFNDVLVADRNDNMVSILLGIGDGMLMDDGVMARVGEQQFYLTTTTGGAANVMSWLEAWLQTEWPELEVYLTSLTDQFSTIDDGGVSNDTLMHGKVRVGHARH